MVLIQIGLKIDSVYNSTKNIGIGTSSPSSALHVLNSSPTNTVPTLTVENNSNLLSSDPTIHFKNGYLLSQTDFTLGINSSHDGGFQITPNIGLTSGNPSFHIDPLTGYVAINNYDPWAELDVVGRCIFLGGFRCRWAM